MSARIFHALALPDGDAQFGVPGPQVMLFERGPDGAHGIEIKRVRIFSPAEALALQAALLSALAATPVTALAAAPAAEDW